MIRFFPDIFLTFGQFPDISTKLSNSTFPGIPGLPGKWSHPVYCAVPLSDFRDRVIIILAFTMIIIMMMMMTTTIIQ